METEHEHEIVEEIRNPAPGFKAILLCMFDLVIGPTIVYQYPEGVVKDNVFTKISSFLIPKVELAGRIISTNCYGLEMVGLPIHIIGAHYKRNYVFFNVVFVFEENVDTTRYQNILRKLGNIWKTLEIEKNIVSAVEQRETFYSYLRKIYDSITTQGECALTIDDSNFIYLKLYEKHPDPPPVFDHQVPVPLVDFEDIANEDWDLILLQILPHIDGVNHIKKIALLSNVNIEMVKKCVEHLVFRGGVVMTEIFLFSNIYTVTPQIHKLISSQEMQEACLEFITHDEHPQPPFEKVFAIYCALQPSTPFQDVCEEYGTSSLHIDERRFITFGLINGLIRIHKYSSYFKNEFPGLVPSK